MFSVSGSGFLVLSITLKPPSPHPGIKANPRISGLSNSPYLHILWGTCKAPTKVREVPKLFLSNLTLCGKWEMRAQNRDLLEACSYWHVVGSHSGEVGDELDQGLRDTRPASAFGQASILHVTHKYQRTHTSYVHRDHRLSNLGAHTCINTSKHVHSNGQTHPILSVHIRGFIFICTLLSKHSCTHVPRESHPHAQSYMYAICYTSHYNMSACK